MKFLMAFILILVSFSAWAAPSTKIERHCFKVGVKASGSLSTRESWDGGYYYPRICKINYFNLYSYCSEETKYNSKRIPCNIYDKIKKLPKLDS